MVPQVHIKDSIATRLLKIVFCIYIIITLSVTVVHMVGEYLYIENDIKRELTTLNHSFNRSISTALFHLDFEQLDQNLKGALDIPTIVGVKILDFTTPKTLQGGIVTARQLKKIKEFPVNLGFGNPFRLITSRAGIYSPEDQHEKIGEVVLYSSSYIVFGRVKLGFLFIVVNSIIKTVALWIIFLIVGRRILSRPLHELTHATQTLNIENLNNLKIDIHTTEGNELKVLETAFNTMIKKLHMEMGERMQAEARLQAIMDNMPTAVYLIDLEGKFQMVNHEFEVQFGIDNREFANYTYYDIFSKEVADSCVMSDADVMRKGVPLTIEERYSIQEQPRTFITVKFPIKNQEGQVTLVCAILTDITQRKKAEEALHMAYVELENRVAERTQELQEANQKLQRANAESIAATKSKSEFLANMSHEIRTPMNGVIAAADLALNLDLPLEVRKYLNIIKSSGDSLLSIINDILDISKIEAGKLELETQPFRIDDVLNDISTLFIKKIQDEKLELLIDIQPDAPLAVQGDALRLKQILTNLVANAIKFSPKGGSITVGVGCVEGYPPQLDKGERVGLAFYVKDTGVGIKNENLNKLFEQFTQEDVSTTRKYGGSGLGLTICKYLVELMGGTIGVESEFGKGATFYFSVYLTRQTGPAPEPFPVYQDIQNLKVLVVDDNQDSLKITEKYLRSLACRATLLSTGKDVLQCLRTESFDLIIIDWLMPEMSGMETVNAIRQELQLTIPIVMMTAYIGQIEKSQAHQVGVDFVLTKPISSSSLMDAMMTALGKFPTKVPERTAYAKPQPLQLDGKQSAIDGKRILIAEDNPTNQEIAQAVLQNTGALLTIANNGQEAVEAVMGGEFDIVLMDVQMPEMDGLEATRMIRREKRFVSLPIIAMTAHAMVGDKEKCIEAGMNDYVTKPINQKALFLTLSKIVSQQTADPDTWIAKDLKDAKTKADMIKRIWQAFDDHNLQDLKTCVQILNQQANQSHHIRVANLTKNIERLCVNQIDIQKSLIEALARELEGGGQSSGVA